MPMIRMIAPNTAANPMSIFLVIFRLSQIYGIERLVDRSVAVEFALEQCEPVRFAGIGKRDARKAAPWKTCVPGKRNVGKKRLLVRIETVVVKPVSKVFRQLHELRLLGESHPKGRILRPSERTQPIGAKLDIRGAIDLRDGEVHGLLCAVEHRLRAITQKRQCDVVVLP